MPDNVRRELLPTGAKDQIRQALAQIPDGKRGALVLFATKDGATATLAARIGDRWTIAGGAGVPWRGEKPNGWVSIAGSW